MTEKRAGKTSANYSRNAETGKVMARASEKLLQRLPRSKGRITALNEVHEKLAKATVLFREDGEGGRRGVFRAVVDVSDYLNSQGIPKAALEPLLAVAAAIVDADAGTESPIFKPDRNPGDGKPPKPSSQLAYEGYLAVVMECCVRHCKAQAMRPYVKPASEMAAKIIKKSSWPDTGVTATTLREIRERVNQSPSSSIDRRLFDRSMASPRAQERPLDWAKELLANDWADFRPSKNSG